MRKILEGAIKVDWLPVVGYEGLYDISRFGQPYGIKTDTFLKSVAGSSGYLQVTLCKGGEPHHKLIHQLVAEAFLRPCVEGEEVNHKNGNKLDNCAENLEISTRSKNMLHAYRYGLMSCIGENHPSARFKNKDIPVIRQRQNDGETLQAIASDYGVSRKCIWDIVNRETWSHIV